MLNFFLVFLFAFVAHNQYRYLKNVNLKIDAIIIVVGVVINMLVRPHFFVKYLDTFSTAVAHNTTFLQPACACMLPIY